MASYKNINQSSTNIASLSTNTITAVNNIYENCSVVSANTTTTPWFPYTLDYTKGSIFYIPSDYTTASNFNIIITNIPTDTSKVYTLSLVYYQPSNKFYCNGVRCIDAASSYILGTSSTFGTPFFNGGTPTLANAPNLIIQQFSIISIATTSGTFSRYVSTSVSNSY